MEQKYKELLLKDLYARLPYKVKCIINDQFHENVVYELTNICDNSYLCLTANDKTIWIVFDVLNIKPYLFPISSIKHEQRIEFHKMIELDTYIVNNYVTYNFYNTSSAFNRMDWLNKNHFDYRGLIGKGLAIDATGLNIY